MKACRPVYWMLPLLMLAAATWTHAKPLREKPALVLQITIHNMRGDFPMRYKDRLGKGGLRYLMTQGTHYTNAGFPHAGTEPTVGHAALFTGTSPARNGIVAGSWFDRAKDRVITSCEDDRYPLIGKTQVEGEGRAPSQMLAATIGDELTIATNGGARVFSVSLKDQGAILQGGHTGKAFWFSTTDGSFISSSYYFTQYPDWVAQWNAEKHADAYRNRSWQLLYAPSTYLFGTDDRRPFEVDMFGLGTTFPHPLNADPSHFYASLAATPFGDELTADFAKTLIREEKLGQGPRTDFLAVGFSATGSIGRLFGASSLEAEDTILRVDKLLADLFRYVDKEIGLDRTLVVLSSNHGMCETPQHLASLGFDVGCLPSGPIIREILAKALNKRLGVPESIVRLYDHPYVYLDEEEIAKTGVSLALVETTAAEEIMSIPGIAGALTRTDLLKGTVAPTPTNMAILDSFHAGRSGNIHVIAAPSTYVTGKTPSALPQGDDTYVPLFFAGWGIPAQRITRPVTPYDIAPTLASVLEIKAPSGAVGIPLEEVLKEDTPAENWITASRTALP